MTEQEWLTCADPQPMLEFLLDEATNRKFGLFAVACCRRIWHLLIDERSRLAVDMQEGFAERTVTQEEQDEAFGPAYVAEMDLDEAGTTSESIVMAARAAASAACNGHPVGTAKAAAKAVQMERDERPEQCVLIRCIFWYLFRPIALNPTWLTATVRQLAEAIYDERAFDRMPILADALEEAGCTNAGHPDALPHGQEHVRGCWVVDLLQGKS